MSERSALVTRLVQLQPHIVAAICATLALKVSWAYTLSFLLLTSWAVDGQADRRFQRMAHSPLCLAFVAYFGVYLLAMLWTDDLSKGGHMLGRQAPLLLFVLFWASTRQADFRKNVFAFLGGLSVCALLAHYNWIALNWLNNLPTGIQVNKSVGDTAPFVDRIMYAPLLALGTYFALRFAIIEQQKTLRIVLGFVAVLLLSNLMFSGGRAGLAMFLVLAAGLVFELTQSKARAGLILVLAIPLFLLATNYALDTLAKRNDSAVTQIRELHTNPNTSVGQRLIYWTTTLKVFLDNPLFGVGSGDLQMEYAKYKPKEFSATPDSYNPHNQYLMTAATTGLLGLSALGLILYFSFRAKPDAMMLTLLAGFSAVWLFESYLWRSNTAMAFSVLVAVLTAPDDQENAA